MARTRHTQDSWINVGLKALAKSGPSALRAETLARAVGTTKGSFYWHFKDVPDYHSAVLKTWSSTFKARFDTTQTADTAVSRLRDLSLFGLTDVDRAVRAWAEHDKTSARVVRKIDTGIKRAIASNLAELGATHPDFPDIVLSSLYSAETGSTQVETLVDLLLMLKD